MHFANSGQPRPIYCHHGRAQIVESTGLPLGLLEDTEYDEVTIRAHAGDVFVLFSDGIVDAQNKKEELFGRTRLEEVVTRNHEKSADEIVKAIFDAASAHAKGTAAFDDQTVVVVKIKGQKPEVAKATKQKKTNPALRSV
jgi:sigma-B regulation protein RsbU (phosphoserine phosphatase)